MIDVYVWMPKHIANQKNIGHTSLLINQQTYISWWPEQHGLKNVHPIRNRNYFSDVIGERCNPDWNLQLNGLDEEAILEWWKGFGLVSGNTILQGPLPPYNFIKQNCSTVVAIGLKKGGGDEYANSHRSRHIIWTPWAVLHYALSIQKGLTK